MKCVSVELITIALVLSFPSTALCASDTGLRQLASALKIQKKSTATKELAILQGQPPTPFQYRVEQATLVHFWATWCGPCIQELPQLSALRTALNNSGIKILFVSVDSAGPVVVPPYLKKLALPTLDPVWDPRGTLQRKFGVTLLPTTILLDANGYEVARIVGAANWLQSDIKLLRKTATGH